MSIKKLGVLIVAIAMMLTMVAVPAFAAGETISVTYENTSNQPISASNIQVGDIFYAVIKFNNLAEDHIGLGNFQLNFNPSVLQVVASDGNPTTTLLAAGTSIIHRAIEYNYDYAFETVGGGNLIDNASGIFKYNFSSAIIGGSGSYVPYPLSAAELASQSLTIIKIRFKVTGTGNANFSFLSAETSFSYELGMATQELALIPAIESLSIAAEDQDQAAPNVNLFTAKAPTSDANNDGMILGTTTDMEYKLASDPDTAYVACTGTSITGLAAGDYSIRYAAKDGYKASPAVTVTVPPYVPVTGTRITVANLTDINSGAEFNVPITITELPAGTKVKGFEFGVRFDAEVLEYKSYTTTDGYDSTAVDTSNLASGKLGVSGLTSEEGVDGDVLVVTLKFAAKAELATQVTDIELFNVAFSNESNAAVEIPETNIFNGTIGIVEVTDPLVAAKTAAKAELEDYYDGKDQALYSDAGKAALLTAKNDGISAIEAAADVAAVETALVNAKSAIDAVKTAAQELAEYKAAKVQELEDYYDGKDQALYSDAGKAALLTAKDNGVTAINNAADTAAVDAALASAKSAIDAVKTAAQELADYKATKKADLDTYYGTIDLNLYTEAGKDALEAELIAGKAAIDAAESIAAVDEAYDEAIIALYGVPTAVKELDEKVKENEEITIDDITAAGTEGVQPEKLNSYKVALAITRANDGDLDLTKIQAAIDEANTVDEADRGNVYIGAGDENLSVNDAVGARDIRLRKAGFTVAQAVRADENGDGAVDVQDVINILQRVAKKQSDNVPDKQ